jgi:hypothetical protein
MSDDLSPFDREALLGEHAMLLIDKIESSLEHMRDEIWWSTALNPHPSFDNCFDAHDLDPSISFSTAADLARSARRPYLLWSDRVYIVGSYMLIETQFTREVLENQRGSTREFPEPHRARP